MSFSIRGFLPFLCLLTVLFASCSEDFQVGAPYKPVTIVVGLLNTGDSANYIRIQKAYYDEDRSALDIAKIADSNFYSSLVVHLKEINNGSVVADEILPRVDLRQEGYAKDSNGVFFSDPSYAYKTRRFLNPDYRYRLVVVNTATGETDSSETPIIPNTAARFRVDEFVFGFALRFPGTNDRNTFNLTVAVPDNAQTLEGIIRFHYVDKNVNTGLQTDRSVDWLFANATKVPDRLSVTLAVSQRAFFPFLRDAIGDAPADVIRYIDTGEVFVWAGGQELANYQQVNGAQGGLTADQIKPIYTNIKGANAYGLFSTRALRVYSRAPVDDQSLDSLLNNVTTKPLQFRGRSDH